MLAKIIREYPAYDQRRYSRPWVARCKPGTVFPDFSEPIGGFTGSYGTGEGGKLYVNNPKEGVVYMYGQRNYKKGGSERGYVVYRDGAFRKISQKEALEYDFGDRKNR